jgi:transposase, IS30 family
LERLQKIWAGINPLSVESCVEIREIAGIVISKLTSKPKRRHIHKPKAIKLDEAMKRVITSHIEEKWSPEQISGRLKRLEKPSVSHETIYRFLLTDKIAGGELYKHLRHQAKP